MAAGVGLAMLAAIGFGGYFPFMHAAGNADFWWASLIFRVTSTTRDPRTPLRSASRALGVPRRLLPWLALIGFGDMFGNLLYAAASTSGLVSVTSVLASLYPIVTVVLARVLGERVARSQEAGIGLTLAGVALISAG